MLQFTICVYTKYDRISTVYTQRESYTMAIWNENDKPDICVSEMDRNTSSKLTFYILMLRIYMQWSACVCASIYTFIFGTAAHHIAVESKFSSFTYFPCCCCCCCCFFALSFFTSQFFFFSRIVYYKPHGLLCPSKETGE